MAGKLDPLLAAVISKLPANTNAGWPTCDRVAWLDMMTKALDVVYGVNAPSPDDPNVAYRVVIDKLGPAPRAPAWRDGGTALLADPPAPPRVAHAGHEFYVAADGTVCNADATPVMMIDVPPEETIFDYRPVSSEFRDLDSIVWADGARGRAGLAEGVSFCGPG